MQLLPMHFNKKNTKEINLLENIPLQVMWFLSPYISRGHIVTTIIAYKNQERQ